MGRAVGDLDLCSKNQSGLQSWRFPCTSGLLVGTYGCDHLAEGGSAGKSRVVSALGAKDEESSTCSGFSKGPGLYWEVAVGQA